MNFIEKNLVEALEAAENSDDPKELKRLIAMVGSYAFYSLAKSRELHDKLMVDSLTGLPSGDAYKERIEPELVKHFSAEKNRRSPLSYILIKADMDGLREVNNTLGHSEGDRRLQYCAMVLQNSIRCTDWVGRLGDKADEFLIVIRINDEEDPQIVFDHIRQRILQASVTDDIEISISIGASYSGEHASLDSCLDSADLAMYETKIASYAERGIIHDAVRNGLDKTNNTL